MLSNLTKIVSMIRKKQNHKLQTNPWHRLSGPLLVCMMSHGKVLGPLTDHLADSFVLENVACVFDVVVKL